MINSDYYIVDENNSNDISKDIIKLLSDNKYTISQTRALFNHVLSDLERFMPIVEIII
jgi:hypothetical protein